jgi:general L-amino acid transport system substrate-binding protein
VIGLYLGTATVDGHAVESAGGPNEYLILPEQISKEPMGPVVRRGDDEWFTIVRWVLFGLIRAEETGITQTNARSKLAPDTDPVARRLSELDEIISKSLTISPGWATRVLESVGNYGEMSNHFVGCLRTGFSVNYRPLGSAKLL